ncbi:hypothetical protein [Haloarcula sp. K1]|uniref:hypothetical protein n=1 Tax=Haloarcula sp. K1 TaxID=1622207 RepID=UPI0007BB90BB|nr:hypothetical protein [Haloarcula sp. K1]KZX46349.1 hypothetical protein AV929_16400 [Haloarcula sp. K1]
MHAQISLTTWCSDTRHIFTFIGDTERGTIYPKEMNQGGEHYRIGWDDVPNEVESELDEMGDWEFIEE